MSHNKSHNECEKIVHRPYNSCISNIQEIHKDSIEFSLSSADKRAVGFIPAEELAILILELNSITSRHRSSWTLPIFILITDWLSTDDHHNR